LQNKKVKYISVSEYAKKWNIPDRTARDYCNTAIPTNSIYRPTPWHNMGRLQFIPLISTFFP
jgi:hypothetical protein